MKGQKMTENKFLMKKCLVPVLGNNFRQEFGLVHVSKGPLRERRVMKLDLTVVSVQ